MHLKRVTITGVDARTNLLEVRNLAQRFPFAEFALLVSESAGGKKPRYLTIPEVNSVLSMLRAGGVRHLAVHICGRWSRLLLQGKAAELHETLFELVLRQGAILMDGGRVQWNVNPARMKREKWDIEGILDILHECFYNGNLILQRNNKESADLANALREVLAHKDYAHHRLHINVLHDLSGGRGLTPEGVPPPVGAYCGYAGGFSDENVGVRLRQMSFALPDEQEVWIDMESGVRTDDWLDLKKVESVLETCESFMAP